MHCTCSCAVECVYLFRQWPKPVMLRPLEDNIKLGFPVWDPRVSPMYFHVYFSKGSADNMDAVFTVSEQIALFCVSLLQAVNLSGEGLATWVLLLHSTRFPVSSTVSHKSSMLYLTTSVHLFLCLPRLRCPRTSASRIRLTQSSSSLRCICPYDLSLALRTLSMMHATPVMRRMSSFLFLSLT